MTSTADNDKNIPSRPDWYIESLDDADGWKGTRKLLLEYTNIPEDKIAEHVYRIRERAFAIYTYPCIGTFRFLDLSIGQSDCYPEILQRLKDGQKLLDLGCCFGQDERRLVADGVPSENLHACDLKPEFTELGYDLFLDRATLRTQFFAANVFDTSNENLNRLDGKIDIINASSFFHLFPYEEQKMVARRVTRLLRRREGSLVVGRQVANVNPGVHDRKIGDGPGVFRHNAESWEKMWKEVGDETCVEWQVEAELRMVKEKSVKSTLHVEGTKMMKFSVRML